MPVFGKKSGQARRNIGLVQEMLRLCKAENGRPPLLNCCRPEQVGTKEHGKMLKRIHILEDGRGTSQRGKRLED